MSGRPGPSDGVPLPQSNLNGVPAGDMPPNADTNPQHLPNPAVPRLPLATTAAGPPQAQSINNSSNTSNIPPLMGIQPTLPASLPPAQLPSNTPAGSSVPSPPAPLVPPALTGNPPPSSGGPTASTSPPKGTPPHFPGGGKGAQRTVAPGEPKQRSAGKQMKDKEDGDDSKYVNVVFLFVYGWDGVCRPVL